VGFRVGGEEFVIDILRVQEIIRTQQLTRVPDSPDCMEGVMNLRGKIIPVIGLRKRFGLEEVAPDKQNRIVWSKSRAQYWASWWMRSPRSSASQPIPWSHLRALAWSSGNMLQAWGRSGPSAHPAGRRSADERP